MSSLTALRPSGATLRVSALLAGAVAGLGAPAWAGPAGSVQPPPVGSTPVPVQGAALPPATGVRGDLSSVCPQARVDLPEALAATWHQVGRAGTVTARLQVQGDRVLDAQALGGHPRQRWAVRWALAGLDCRADRPGVQTFAVQVRFADPGTGTAVAWHENAGVAQVALSAR